jgi:signal peptidase II
VRLELMLSAGLVLVVDQLTKALVARYLAVGQSMHVGWVKIRHVSNRGGSRRPLPNRTLLLVLWGALLVGIILVTQHGFFFKQPAAQLGLGAALGGAAGNLYDRFQRGAVIDFLDVGWWPVFNLADVAITLGAMAAIWSIR